MCNSFEQLPNKFNVSEVPLRAPQLDHQAMTRQRLKPLMNVLCKTHSTSGSSINLSVRVGLESAVATSRRSEQVMSVDCTSGRIVPRCRKCRAIKAWSTLTLSHTDEAGLAEMSEDGLLKGSDGLQDL